MAIVSNTVTFLDLTDTKKIDVHIASNYPLSQIYDANSGSFTPDWSTVNGALTLTATVYADSKDVTQSAAYRWYEVNTPEITLSDKQILQISENKLNSTPILTFVCEAKYNNEDFENRISFARITTGRNGYTPQKGVDYFDGTNGEDGKSVGIKGVAYTDETFVAGAQVKLYSDPEYKNEITIGGDSNTVDGYLVDGYLCVYTGEYFIWTGKIQGPQGQKGESTYLFTRYADDQNGSGFSTSPVGKKYIGFYRYSENTLPSAIGTGYDIWTWVKYVGEDAKSVSLNATSQVFRVDKEGKVSPSTLTVAPQVVNTSITKWEYNTNGGTFSTTPPAGVVRGSDGKITITGASMTANSIAIRMGDDTYSDTLTVYKVYDGATGDKGADAPMAFLTNENITFAANANGQIAGTTVYCNVVAYRGTTKVTPTIDTISDLPDGMTIDKDAIITESNELIIPIKIANNATFGSTANINGSFDIPVLTPVNTNLKLTWSKVNAGPKGDKGETGEGIKSTTVWYGVSDSASTQPSDNAWQSTIPTVADGKYLWTKTVIDYTDDAMEDTVVLTYAKQGIKGDTGSAGSSVTVSKIEYQAGTSATTAPTGTWSNSVVSVVEGNYLWTKTTFSDGKVAYGVAKQGAKGDKGNTGDKGADAYTVMLTNESHIFAGNVSSAIAASATTQVLAYKGSTAQSVTIVSVDGKTASTSSTATSIAGLSFTCSALSGASPTITFTCTTSFVSPSGTIPIVLNVDGVTITKMFTYSIAFKGTVGTPASLVSITPSAAYFKSTTGKDGTFTPDYIYLYPRFQTVTFSKWEYSVNGGTTWVAVSGANGLTVSTYNSVANTLRIARTSTLYTDAITSISFRCVSSNTSVYDTVSIAKIYDVVDLELGVTFQLYAPKGYFITNETPEVTLQAFAYEGSQAITNATFKWYSWNGETWGTISEETGNSLTVDKTDVMKTSVYKCEMTYDGEVYEATATVEDKTDIYESLIRVAGKYSATNRHYWILYTTVYSEDGERDALLGPISITAPTSPTTGAYWYKIDETNYTVTLMKYSGTAWASTTDKQELMYDWFLFNDTEDMVTLGTQNKVIVITANDFSRVCNVQCNIFDPNNVLLSRNNQVLNDPSDPIVSQTAPPNPTDGQLWIQMSSNGTYIIYIWNEGDKKWIMSEADSTKKVYVEKPNSYVEGDIWIVGGDYQPIVYVAGVAQTTKHLAGTMLKAQYSSETYKDSDWVEALNYKAQLDDVTAELSKYKQYISIDDTGLIMEAKGSNGQSSEFKTKLTNTELGFYQGDDKVAYINNNQLNISKAQITNGLSVSGTSPILTIGGFSLIQESNGSFSIMTNI